MQWQAGQPKHPQYSVDRVRLSSYSKWPIGSSQSPAMLSDAGFFYAGFGDCVRCFYCGGGLRNWEEDDIPFIEHARWYPQCDFLRRQKGDAFIQKHNLKSTQNGSESQTLLSEETIGLQELLKERENDVIENVQEENQLIAITSVVEMGYPLSTVEACADMLRKQGKANFKAADIMKVILQNEDQSEAVCVSQGKTSYISADMQSLSLLGKKSSRPGLSDGATGISSQNRGTNLTEYQSLLQETEQLREQMLCKICLDNDACVVYLPCGHMVTCQQCSNTIRKCCICRQLIKGTVRAYL